MNPRRKFGKKSYLIDKQCGGINQCEYLMAFNYEYLFTLFGMRNFDIKKDLDNLETLEEHIFEDNIVKKVHAFKK